MKNTMFFPCPEWAERLSDFHSGDLALADRKIVAAHLTSCQTCASALDEYHEMDELIHRALSNHTEAHISPVEAFRHTLHTGRIGQQEQDFQARQPDTHLSPIFEEDEDCIGATSSLHIQLNISVRRHHTFPVLLVALSCFLILGLGLLLSSGVSREWLGSGSPLPRTPSTVSPTSTSPLATVNASGIAGKYNGTILDLTTNSSTTMVLRGMQQNQGSISGYIAIGPNGPKILGNGSLSGTIDANNILQFIVRDAKGNAVFFFRGELQPPSLLSGGFYSCSGVQGGPCNQAPGSYGTWSVNRAS